MQFLITILYAGLELGRNLPPALAVLPSEPAIDPCGAKCCIRVHALAIGMGCTRHDRDSDPSARVSARRWISDLGTPWRQSSSWS
jgi:hypothetical protein